MTDYSFDIVYETENVICVRAGARCVPYKRVREGERWVKHVQIPYSRIHTLSYVGRTGKEKVHCSEPDCIVNKNHKPVS